MELLYVHQGLHMQFRVSSHWARLCMSYQPPWKSRDVSLLSSDKWSSTHMMKFSKKYICAHSECYPLSFNFLRRPGTHTPPTGAHTYRQFVDRFTNQFDVFAKLYWFSECYFALLHIYIGCTGSWLSQLKKGNMCGCCNAFNMRVIANLYFFTCLTDLWVW